MVSTTPPPPPPLPLPGQAPPPPKTSFVPLLVVGTLGLIALIAGGAAAAMLIVMSRHASSPADAVADAPPATAPVAGTPVTEGRSAPESSVPPAPEPSAEPASPAAALERTAEEAPAADRGSPARRERPATPERPAPPERPGTAERAGREVADDEPVERAIRVGGDIPAPTKIRNVQPTYPQIAQSARIQGVVIIEATIDREGRIAHARVLRSIPLLDQAALDAVRQWEYEPTLLNGVPVPVIVTVTVRFSLH
jgi:protein TonB